MNAIRFDPMNAALHPAPSAPPAGSRLPAAAIALIAALVCLGHPTATAGEALLLKGATVHTVSGPVLAKGQVLIRNGKIAAVGEMVDAGDAQVVDLEGKHLYPGIIASSTLLGLVEISAVRATRDSSEVGQFTPEVNSWIAVNPDSELIPVARANGITHIVPVPQGGWVTGHSGLVALDGWTTEQMVVRKPLALHVDWPDMGLDMTPKEQLKDRSKWKSPEDGAKERRKSLHAFETFFQEAAAYHRARQGAPETPLNPPWEAMRPALRGEIPVVVQANDVRAIKAAAAWARTNQLRWVLSGGRDAAKVASLLASNQIPVIFEHVFDRSLRDTEPYDHLFQTPGALVRAGVLVAISAGTDDMAEADIRNLPYHAAQAAAFGLSREEALKCITLNPARILGVADRLGSIEAGKEASLIAVDGDLLDIRSNVRQMWIAGQPVSLESRHTRLYEKYRRRPAAR